MHVGTGLSSTGVLSKKRLPQATDVTHTSSITGPDASAS